MTKQVHIIANMTFFLTLNMQLLELFMEFNMELKKKKSFEPSPMMSTFSAAVQGLGFPHWMLVFYILLLNIMLFGESNLPINSGINFSDSETEL